MEVGLFWRLLTLLLSALYGVTQYRAMAALGFPRKGLVAANVWLFAMAVGAAFVWAVVPFPLPLLYVAVYLIRAVRFLYPSGGKTKHWFLLNLGYVNNMVLHLVFIGAAALTQGETMRALLTVPVWRMASLTAVLALVIAEDLLFLNCKNLFDALSGEAESEEVGLFMTFLWFCTGYLLVDSLLCVSELEPLYPPLFLIGSSAILMFILVMFLRHIHVILQQNHFKDEHTRLSAELADKDRSAGTLRMLAQRDVLTGVYSRRYVMERLEALVQADAAFSLAFLDLDRLKQVNDQEGHKAGDRYLIRFAESLGGHLREGDILARVGGDEFVVLMPGCAERVARERLNAMRLSATEVDQMYPYGFSYGVASRLAGDPRDGKTLLREADQEMYQDKASRRR